MFEQILPEELWRAAEPLLDSLYEIRIRTGRPVMVNHLGRYRYLGANGMTEAASEAFVAGRTVTESIVQRAANHSLYAVNDQLKQGYLSLAGGARMGIAGEAVEEHGEIATMKNITSLCIRIPHCVRDCAKQAFRMIQPQRGVCSALIISPPGAGKTTYLRDIARLLSESGKNVLLLDERGEFTAPVNGELTLPVGERTDVLFHASKRFAFTMGIRSLRPDVIVADELGDSEDVRAVKYALTAGVAVIASIHGASVQDVRRREGFSEAVDGGYFQRYAVLSTRRGMGTLESVSDGTGKQLYFAEET